MKNIHIVFDLDGTLADTQKIHQKIESDFLTAKGVILVPAEIGKTYAGRSPQERIPELLKEKNKSFEVAEITHFVHSKDEKVIELLKQGEIKLMPYVKETLETLNTMGCKLGISSGACREFIDDFITYFGLNEIVQASTSANEVANKKPAPDVFTKSFEILERKYGKPMHTFVIGDGKSDVIGGHSAHAKTILYNNANIDTTDEKIASILDYVLDNFDELPAILYTF